MTTSEQWTQAINDACSEPDPAQCNRRITLLHHELSEALAEGLGHASGPNFHTWAVWGSRKAGATIRQEDLGSAIYDATVTAGVVGSAVGASVGLMAGAWFRGVPEEVKAAFGASVGTFAGGWTGKQLAHWSRAKASRLVLQGNRTVLQDIGTQSGRFLELLQQGATTENRAAFFAGLRPGPTSDHGQDRLATAFRSYLMAFDATDLPTKREAMIAGNCQIVHHEHIRLDPFIRGAMPYIVRRCATQRLMTFEIGDRVLTVGDDVPGVNAATAARDWAKIDERMRYVFALFRKFHTAPEVFRPPYPGQSPDAKFSI